MTKSDNAGSFSLLGIIFMAAGALVIILAILNYLQDGKISLTILLGFLIIFLGAWLYSNSKKQKK